MERLIKCPYWPRNFRLKEYLTKSNCLFFPPPQTRLLVFFFFFFFSKIEACEPVIVVFMDYNSLGPSLGSPQTFTVLFGFERAGVSLTVAAQQCRGK